MPAKKIYISYRCDDDPSAAARVRDGLARGLRRSALFIDVDNLRAGQRFDEELAKALATCKGDQTWPNVEPLQQPICGTRRG